MNNILKIISITLLVLNCLTLSAQTQKEQLTGIWNFDFHASTANMEEKAKTILAKNPAVQAKLESNYRNRQIIFNADGNYIFHLHDGKEERGTWTSNNTNRSITMTTSQGHTQNLTIILISPTVMILEPEANGKMIPMLSRWYFTKN
ncbi:lipocalin family protein [Flavobacterium limi]|uniref:Lipocalin-like domain-containing protein n=1 Tax=Flavobacterium limi TaxID=2045105 RepID=A0ABQ1UYL5_9FLAO|nr:lipocalin family protein [Flavobacterium limi]GGF30325.1 hypothetical protein GCM10011518_44460 [Flavobacterium limi]